MKPKPLFATEPAVVQRQPKTDRLILHRFLKERASDKRLDEPAMRAAHEVLLKWADLETSGQLAKLNETQIQGDFLADVFGTALGYVGPTDSSETWQRHQHYPIAGQTPDAILGQFHKDQPMEPLAVVELKGPKVHLDRDRSNGRTAVDQCWDYLNNTAPQCRWGIVSNIVSFRLYERSSTKRAYEHFTLQSLRDFEQFQQFYVLFHRQGLIEPWMREPPRAVALLNKSAERQREVGDKLYDAYSTNRILLIEHLHFELKHPLDDAIEMAQRLYDFENKKVFFPDVHASFKFCILNFGGPAVKTKEADFVFFLHRVEELEDRKRHVALSANDIALLNPNTRTCPIFRTRRDATITKAIYRRVPILIDQTRKGPTGNPWGVTFKTMFHQTNDAELFLEPDALKRDGYKLEGNRWKKGKKVCLPLYEAKMLQAFDHRAANVVTDQANWVRQGQTERTDLVHHQNPEYLAMPRFWVSEESVVQAAGKPATHFLCFKDVTSPTNQRTMIAAFVPFVGLANSAPILLSESSPTRQCCLLANLNSLTYDFIVRQKISNVHLNFFIVEQIPTLPPDAYTKPCPWQRGVTLEGWISERVLKLTCTAEDMLPLAEACGFTAGSFQQEYGGRLNKWDEAERAALLAELDAAFFHLYGVDRDEAEYILSTFKGLHDRRPLFPDQCSPAESILRKYAEMAYPG